VSLQTFGLPSMTEHWAQLLPPLYPPAMPMATIKKRSMCTPMRFS